MLVGWLVGWLVGYFTLPHRAFASAAIFSLFSLMRCAAPIPTATPALMIRIPRIAPPGVTLMLTVIIIRLIYYPAKLPICQMGVGWEWRVKLLVKLCNVLEQLAPLLIWHGINSLPYKRADALL